MGTAYLFYNPLAGDGTISEDLDILEFVLDDPCVCCDMTKPETYEQMLFQMKAEDYLVVCGGDGTLNRFVNLTADVDCRNEILYYPGGRQNNFALDHGRRGGSNPFSVSRYLTELPTIRLGNRSGLFLTGAVFAANPKLRGTSRGKQQYDKDVDVRIRADKTLYHFDKVCFAGVMHGRHCLDGMIPDPQRNPGDDTLSCVLIHDCGRWRGKYYLRQLKKGRKPNPNHFAVCRASKFQLQFSNPVTVLTDGEVQTEVTELTAGKKA